MNFKNYSRIIWFGVIALINHSFAVAQTYSVEINNLLDSIAVQDVPSGAPGIATAIIDNGVTTYSKCAGFADFADSSLITTDTRFNLASNGKQFTALAVLELIDQGKLALKDDFRKHLPQLFPGKHQKITIENLLNHTSGIRDIYDLLSLQGVTWWEKSYTNSDILSLIEKQEDLNFAPPTKYLYSNTNYILLAIIIEKVSGISFVSYTNNLFKQLGMTNTSFEDGATKIRGPIARAYFNFDTWTTYDWIWKVCGDGNLFSTLSDQIRWEKIVQGKIITPIKTAVIQTTQRINANSFNQEYGFGLEHGNYKGLAYRFHEGATGAWKATVLRFPGKTTSIICLTNTGKSIPSVQTRQMADVLFNLVSKPVDLITRPRKTGKFVAINEITGNYLTPGDFSFSFETRDEKLYLIRSGRNDVELEREADNIFHQVYDTAFKQEFAINKDGEMQVTAYHTSHQPYILTRLKARWGDFDFKSLNGNYFNSETNTYIKITFQSDKSYSVRVGTNDSTSGKLVSPGKMLLDKYTLSFTDRATDTISLNGDRVKGIKFVRIKKTR